MIEFCLKCMTSTYKFSCDESFFVFGNLNVTNEQFYVHIIEYCSFLNTIKEIFESYFSENLQKKIFLVNDLKGYIYEWHIVQTVNLQNLQSFTIKFVCLNSDEITFVLLFTFDQFVELVKCFQYSIFSTLPLQSNFKFWLKYCSKFDIELFKNNDLNLLKNAELFCSLFNCVIDKFILLEIFQYYFSFIKCYKKVTELLEHLQ